MTIVAPESATAAQADLLSVLIAATIVPPRAYGSLDEGSLTVRVHYLPAADPSQVVDPRDRCRLLRFERQLYALGIDVAVRQSDQEAPAFEITVQTPADASALAQYIVDILPPHAAAACRLRRAFANAGIPSCVTVARPLQLPHRCEHCQLCEGDSPAWCPRCLPREVALGRLSPQNAALLLRVLPEAAPDWLADTDLDDISELRRVAAALQSALRALTGEEMTVLAASRCGVHDEEPKGIDLAGSISAAAAELIAAAVETGAAARSAPAAYAPALELPVPPAASQAIEVERPLPTVAVDNRQAAAYELEQVLWVAHDTNPRHASSSHPHGAVIAVYVDRLPLCGITVDPTREETIRAFEQDLLREAIGAHVTDCTEEGQPRLRIALNTVREARYLRQYIIDHLREDCAAAWSLYVALEQAGIDSAATADPHGHISVEWLSPDEALRLHELLTGCIDNVARALDLTHHTDVRVLANRLASTLHHVLNRTLTLSVIRSNGACGPLLVSIESRLCPRTTNHLAAALTQALLGLPTDLRSHR